MGKIIAQKSSLPPGKRVVPWMAKSNWFPERSPVRLLGRNFGQITMSSLLSIVNSV